MNTLRACTVLALSCASVCHSAFLTEGFDDINNLAGKGFVLLNESSPLGSTGWFQGSLFAAESGPADSYLAANFLNAGVPGVISNWLLSPTLTFNNGDIISFYTRTDLSSVFPDSLELRLSTNGASTATSDFSTLLLSINSAFHLGGYPEDWTLYTAVLSGLPGSTDGRIAFRYYVDDTVTNGNYVGIDTLTIGAGSEVPEPATWLLAAFGVSVAGYARRY